MYARRFGTGQWSFIGPGSENKWYSIKEDGPKLERMLLEFRGQLMNKGHGKLSIHYFADQETIKTFA